MATYLILRVALAVTIFSLVLHQRLAPHAGSLDHRLGGIFRGLDRVLGPPLKLLRAKAPPLPIGPRLSLETSHLSLLVVLLFAITFL